MNYVIDTNIISLLMKGDASLKAKIAEVIQNGAQVFINAISYYEIKRGLLATQVTNKKLDLFDSICNRFGVVFLDKKEIFDCAAEIYAGLRKDGNLIEDADILIASIAKSKNLVLVSQNVRHFARIDTLPVEDWGMNPS